MDRYQLRGGAEGLDLIVRTLLSAGVLAIAATACGDGASRTDDAETGDQPATPASGPEFETVPIEAVFVPRWESPSTPSLAEDAEEAEDALSLLASEDPDAPRTAVVHLDVSRPMGGFLPVGAAAERQEEVGANQFRTIVQWVPDQLTRAYPTATLAWRLVGEDVRPVSELPRLVRSGFAASASRIDLALGTALAELQSGQSDVAAIVSDLLGTGENLPPGPLALLPHLQPWLDSELVRSGELHLGIIGAKAAYWGVESRTCPLRDNLGCWYSERGREWRRMDDLALAPFYVLLMGRDADAMATILESIANDAQGQGIETVTELLTAASRHRNATGSCVAFVWDDDRRTRQYSLRLDDDEYACVRDEPATLACAFDGGLRPTEVRLTDSTDPTDPADSTDPPDPTDATDGFAVDPDDIGPDGEFEVGVHCEVLRAVEPSPDLLVDVRGTFTDDAPSPPWGDWSIDTDDVPSFPGGTLQLRYFVQDVRLAPDHHRTDSLRILRARGS